MAKESNPEKKRNRSEMTVDERVRDFQRKLYWKAKQAEIPICLLSWDVREVEEPVWPHRSRIIWSFRHCESLRRNS